MSWYYLQNFLILVQKKVQSVGFHHWAVDVAKVLHHHRGSNCAPWRWWCNSWWIVTFMLLSLHFIPRLLKHKPKCLSKGPDWGDPCINWLLHSFIIPSEILDLSLVYLSALHPSSVFSLLLVHLQQKHWPLLHIVKQYFLLSRRQMEVRIVWLREALLANKPDLSPCGYLTQHSNGSLKFKSSSPLHKPPTFV